MKAHFSFSVDVARNLVSVTMSGFFEAGDIARFLAGRDAAYADLRCAPNQHLTLVDIRDMDIQSQDSVSSFQQVLAQPELASKRIAFVVSRSLARLQVKRAANGRNAAYFLSSEEAERWLFEPEAG